MPPKRRKLFGQRTAAASATRAARASETTEQTSLCLSQMAHALLPVSLQKVPLNRLKGWHQLCHHDTLDFKLKSV